MEDLKVRHQELLKEKRLTALSVVLIAYNKVFISHMTWGEKVLSSVVLWKIQRILCQENKTDFLEAQQHRSKYKGSLKVAWALYLQADYPLEPLVSHSLKTWQRGLTC